MSQPKKSKEELRQYMKEWRASRRELVRARNRRYYLRNKGYLNKSRTSPWGDKKVVERILHGDIAYINIMLRILRPHKDPFIQGGNYA